MLVHETFEYNGVENKDLLPSEEIYHWKQHELLKYDRIWMTLANQ